MANYESVMTTEHRGRARDPEKLAGWLRRLGSHEMERLARERAGVPSEEGEE